MIYRSGNRSTIYIHINAVISNCTQNIGNRLARYAVSYTVYNDIVNTILGGPGQCYIIGDGAFVDIQILRGNQNSGIGIVNRVIDAHIAISQLR